MTRFKRCFIVLLHKKSHYSYKINFTKSYFYTMYINSAMIPFKLFRNGINGNPTS